MLHPKYRCLIGAMLLHLCLGNLSTSGNLIPYLASYMRCYVDESIGHEEIQWVASIGQIAFGLFAVLGGLVEAKIGSRKSCFVGTVILSYGMLLSYSTVQTSVPLLAVTYGFTQGLGTTMNYGVPLYAANRWFPSSPGLVSGLVLSFYYTGYTSSMLLQLFYLNPHGLHSDILGYFDDKDLLERVPSLFLWMAAICFSVQLIGCSLINRPSEHGSLTCEYEDHSEATYLLYDRVDSEIPALEYLNKSDVEPRALFRHKLFVKLWFTNLLNSFVTVSLTTTYKSFGLTFISDDDFLTTVICIGAVTNAFGSIMWGCIMDRSSYKVCMIAITSCLSLSVATLPLVPRIGSLAYVFWGMVVYFLTAGNYTVMMVVTKKTFGTTHAAANVGVLFTAQAVSALLVAICLQLLLRHIDYSGCYVAQAVCPAIAMVLTMTFPDRF